MEDSGVILPDSLPPLSPEAVAINRVLRKDRNFKALLRGGGSFTLPVAVHGRLYAVSFLRMHDVEEKGVGYLICYGADPFLKSLQENHFISLIGAWALFISLGLLFYRQEESRRGLLRERRHLKAVTETIIEGLYVTDENGIVTLANPAACALLGYSQADIIGKEARQFIHCQSGGGRMSAQCPLFRKVMAGGIYTGEERFRTAFGTILQVEAASAPLQNEDGMIIGTVTAFRDITERKRQEGELRRLATTDVLTGLVNRRSFFERLEQEIERYKRFGRNMALLMVDLDHFKKVNDTLGHAAGDEVLQQFAVLALHSLRKIDLIGRLGGEEFIILLPGADVEGVRRYAERLRRQVAEKSFATRAGEVDITVSIGATLVAAGDRDCDELLSRADRALYMAKKKGRNRVEMELGGAVN
jgi:diguanylate cyclase